MVIPGPTAKDCLQLDSSQVWVVETDQDAAKKAPQLLKCP